MVIRKESKKKNRRGTFLLQSPSKRSTYSHRGFAMSRHWNSKQLTDALRNAAADVCLHSGYRFVPEAGQPSSIRDSRTLGTPEEGT